MTCIPVNPKLLTCARERDGPGTRVLTRCSRQLVEPEAGEWQPTSGEAEDFACSVGGQSWGHRWLQPWSQA